MFDKGWGNTKRWVDNHLSLIGDLKDATNGFVDLNYTIPGWNVVYSIGNAA